MLRSLALHPLALFVGTRQAAIIRTYISQDCYFYSFYFFSRLYLSQSYNGRHFLFSSCLWQCCLMSMYVIQFRLYIHLLLIFFFIYEHHFCCFINILVSRAWTRFHPFNLEDKLFSILKGGELVDATLLLHDQNLTTAPSHWQCYGAGI